MKLTPYETTGYPTYDIDLEAPPDTRWKHLAQKEAKNIDRLLNDVVRLSVKEADCYPASIRPLVIAAGKGAAGSWTWSQPGLARNMLPRSGPSPSTPASR